LFLFFWVFCYVCFCAVLSPFFSCCDCMGPLSVLSGVLSFPPPPPTGRTRNTPYRSNPYPTNPTGSETPQGKVFSRFVPSIGSCSQFCLILQPHYFAVPFPPTFASPWRNSLVKIHGGTTFLKAKFGTTPQKRPKNDLNWGVGSSWYK